ncbi:LON peptidase substrate-binding domain-containing protein [Alkalisalibacterium limincola]|uniref:ATP-dependent protease n=1 Tax=Alkalisalibacterium limincola TaxID=2699169 RepID=A0A5C8KH17_9GAMM|nr:LON peptidase substrate-binding domain-containing protein [Alkalisalibacterium limincola]TXK59116.1 ATP-dependent protease [Alkalisalibacterium limincola]
MSDLATGPQTLPLFPLGTVLLPGAELRLRIFEARYLDLVRTCSRQGTGFGVCLLLEGHEVGGGSASAATGTEARITDFGTTDEGLLALTVVGGRRFHVEHTRVRDNGLVVGEVRWHETPEPEEVRPEHGLLSQLLERIVAHFGGAHARAGPRDYDDADWVGWRLSELLPLSPLQRQSMLEEGDPHRRLDRILELLPELPRE